MTVKIREAVTGDIDPLIRCLSRFMEHHIAVDKRFTLKEGVKEKWGEQIFEWVIDPDILVLVAEDKTNIIGCAHTIIKRGALDFGPDRIGYLCDVYVDPDYRRQGIARRFLLTAQKWLKEKGINVIEASWSVYCDEAQNTWPKLGFEPMSISGQLKF
jgi:GNAT superfamily N-acetyltransferase